MKTLLSILTPLSILFLAGVVLYDHDHPSGSVQVGRASPADPASASKATPYVPGFRVEIKADDRMEAPAMATFAAAMANHLGCELSIHYKGRRVLAWPDRNPESILGSYLVLVEEGAKGEVIPAPLPPLDPPPIYGGEAATDETLSADIDRFVRLTREAMALLDPEKAALTMDDEGEAWWKAIEETYRQRQAWREKGETTKP